MGTQTPTLIVLNALAEPNRLSIVELLRHGPRSVGDVANEVGLAQPHASRHLRILAEAGLVSSRRDAQSRIYRLEQSPFRSLEAWLDGFGEVWEERSERLGGYLERLAAGGTASHGSPTEEDLR